MLLKMWVGVWGGGGGGLERQQKVSCIDLTGSTRGINIMHSKSLDAEHLHSADICAS